LLEQEREAMGIRADLVNQPSLLEQEMREAMGRRADDTNVAADTVTPAPVGTEQRPSLLEQATGMLSWEEVVALSDNCSKWVRLREIRATAAMDLISLYPS
jgi:hypothetical protein